MNRICDHASKTSESEMTDEPHFGLKTCSCDSEPMAPIKIVMVSGKTHLSESELPFNTKFFARP
jgi:hypothetical protein